MVKLRSRLVPIVCLLIWSLAFSVSGQEKGEMWVNEITVRTINHLVVTVRSEGKEVIVGEDLTIPVYVKNEGKKAVYFVKKENPEFTYRAGSISVHVPSPFPEEKEEYDFTFHKIESGGEYTDKIVIPGRLISVEENLRITIGLAFVSDIKGIDRKLRPGEDPLRLRGPLGRRIEDVRLGELRLSSAISVGLSKAPSTTTSTTIPW